MSLFDGKKITRIIIALCTLILTIRGYFYFFTEPQNAHFVNSIKSRKFTQIIEPKESQSSSNQVENSQEVKKSEDKILTSVQLENIRKQNLEELQNLLKQPDWEMSEDDCSDITATSFENDYDYFCKVEKPSSDDLKFELKEGYINNRLVMVRHLINGVNEPYNYDNEREEPKLFEILFGDYIFLVIFLNKNLLAYEYHFDLDSFKESLTFEDNHKEKHFKGRIEVLLKTISEIKTYLKRQCDVVKWRNSCQFYDQLEMVNFQQIIKEVIEKSSEEKTDQNN